ncbi:hypothetical protein K4K59_013034 [Colletotrichum sp. SAR11_240]|nr:hypothetical protein K4K59_013034 [Colletotrichum sp. SAR11_240]
MCEGTATTMSCGHTLRSRLRDCGKGADCNGELWKPAFIDDSCAACHQPMHLRENRALHEAEHAILMADYRQAKNDGNGEEMLRLHRAMMAHTRLSRLRNFTVSLTREEPLGDVKWPIPEGETGNNAQNDGAGGSESSSRS